MRGRNESQVTMLGLVTPDQRVPREHPWRARATTSRPSSATSPTH